MKLADLKLTPTGAAATSKLGKQVHKATVAAAMEPKLKLGVLGIEIGQEQSKGLTSRINEAAVGIDEAIRLVRKLADMLSYDGLPESNAPDLWKTAIRIGQGYDDGQSKDANLIIDLLDKLEGRMNRFAKPAADSNQLDYVQWFNTLEQLGVPDNPIMSFFKQLIAALRSAEKNLPAVATFSADLRSILDFFDFATQGLDADGGHSFDSLQIKLIRQVCTKLGFKVA